MTDDERTSRNLVLEDGSTITLNTNRMTISEYRHLFDKDANEDFGDVVLAKVASMSIEELRAIGHDDYMAIVHRFWKLVREANRPDPN